MDTLPPVHTSGHAHAPTEEVYILSSECLDKKYNFSDNGNVTIIEIKNKNEEITNKIDVSSSKLMQQYHLLSLFGRFSLSCLPDGSFGYTFLGYRPSGKGASVQVQGNLKFNANLEMSSTQIRDLPHVDLRGFDHDRSIAIKFRH